MTKQDLLFGRSPIASGFGDYLHTRTRGTGTYPMSDISYRDEGAPDLDYEQLEYERNKSALGRGIGAVGTIGGALSTFMGNPVGAATSILGLNLMVKNTPGAPKDYSAWDYSKDAFTSLLNGRDETNMRSEQGKLVYEVNPLLEQLNFEKEYVSKLLDTEAELANFRANPTPENNNVYQQKKQEVDQLTPQYVASIQDRVGKGNTDVTSEFLSNPAAKQLSLIDEELSKVTDQSNAINAEITDLRKSIWDRELGNNWLLNHKVSEFYTNKEEESEFGFTDLDAWMFKVPGTLGSSFASAGAQALGIGAAYAANLARTAVLQSVSASTLAPQTVIGGQLLAHGIAIAGTAATIGTQLYSRERETFAELFENYSQKVRKYSEQNGIDLNRLIEEGKAQLQGTVDISKLTDDEILDAVIASNVPTSDDRFNAIRTEARSGLDHFYNQNMALSASDIAQTAVAIPFVGSMMSSIVAGGAKAAKLGKIATALNKGIDNVIDYGAKVAPALKVAASNANAKAFGKYIGRGLVGRTLFTSISEAYEEGNQYIGGQRFINNMYEGRNSSVIHGVWDNISSIYEASKAILGIGESVFADDEELFQNMIAGGMIGGLMNLPMQGPANVRALTKQLQTNAYVRNLTAEQLKEKENFAKVKLYANHSLLGKQDNLTQSLKWLKNNLPEGLTEEDIDAEITRAKRVMDIANSSFISNVSGELGIDKKSDRFVNLVAMADYTLEKFENEREIAQNLNAEYNHIYNTEHFKNVAESLTTDPEVKGIISMISKFNTEQYALRELIDTLRENKENIEKFNNQFGTKLNSAKIQDYLNKLEQQEVAQTSRRVELERALKVANANFTLADIESYSSPYGTLMDPVRAYQNTLLGYLSLGDAYEAASIFNGVYHPLIGYQYDSETGTVMEKRSETPYNRLKQVDKAYVNNFINDYLDRYERVEDTTRKMQRSMADVIAGEDPVITQVPDATIAEEFAPEQTTPVETQQPQTTEETPATQTTEATVEEIVTEETSKTEDPSTSETAPDNTQNDIPQEITLEDLLKSTKVGTIEESADIRSENSVAEDLSDTIEDDTSDEVTTTPQRTTSEQLDIANAFESLSEKNSEELNQDLQTGSVPPEVIANMGNIGKYGKTSHTMFYNHTSKMPMSTSIDNLLPLELRPKDRVKKNGDIVETTIEIYNVKGETNVRKAKYVSHTGDISASPQRPKLNISTFANLYGVSLENLFNQVFGEGHDVDINSFPEIAITAENDYNGTITVDFDLLGTTFGSRIDKVRIVVPKPILLADYSIKSGEELGDLLANPAKSTDLDYEITVENYNGNYNPLDESTWDNASIYIYVTDRTNGDKYMAAMKEPSGAALIHEQANSRTQEEVDADLAELRSFRNKIIGTYIDAQKRGAKVVPTNIFKSNGLFNVNVDEYGNIVQRPINEVKGFEIPSDPYAIDKGTVVLGMGKGVRGGNVIVDYNGNTLDGRGRSGKIYIYPKSTPSGETTNIQLNERQFSQDPEVVDLIFDLMIRMGANQVDRVLTNVNGRQWSTGFTPFSLLKVIVNNGPKTLLTEEEKGKVFFLLKKQLNFDSTSQMVQIGETFYKRDELLNNIEKQNEFKDLLRNNFHWTIDKEWLWSKVGHTLDNVQTFFKNTESEKLVIIPGKIEFTLEDVGLKREGREIVDDPDHEGGISWIAWYAKMNVLRSDLQDQLFKAPFLYIEDITTVEQEAAENEQTAFSKEDETLESLLMNTRSGVLEDIDSVPDVTLNSDDVIGSDQWNDYFGVERPFSYQNSTETIDPTSATMWLNEKLGIPFDEIQITQNIITLGYSGAQAMGLMRDDSILLWENAEVGTEYHEAFHRVSLLLLNERERNSLYQSYRNQYSEQNLTDQQVEEALAEDFRDWMISKTRQFKYRVQKFFNRILNFIGATRLMSDTDIADFYSKIAAGHFKNTPINPESLSRFRELYSRGAAFQMGTSDDPVIFKHIPSLYNYYKIIDSLQAMLFYVNDVRTVNDISKLNLGKLRDFVASRVHSAKHTSQQKLVLAEVYHNFDKVFWPDLQMSLENLGIKQINQLNDVNSTEIEKGNVESGELPWYDKASFEISKKDNALFTVKMFMAQMPETTFEYSGNNRTPLNKTVIDPLTGLPSFVDFDTTWNTLLNNLYDVETYDDIVNRVAKLSTVNPFFATLHRKLANNEQLPDKLRITKELKTQLLRTIKSHRYNFYYVSYGNVEDGNTVKLSFRVGDSENLKASRMYPILWSGNFVNHSGLVTNNTVNLEKLQTIVDRFNELVKTTSAKVNSKSMTQEELGRSKEAFVAILNDLGVTIDIDVLNTAMLNMEDIIGFDSYKAFANMIENRRARSIYNFINGTLGNLLKHKPATYKVRNKDVVKPLDRIFTRESFMVALAEAYNVVHPRPDEMMVLGPDGTLLYPISQNNYLTDTIRRLNRKPPATKRYNDLVDNLSKVTYNKRSRILNNLRAGNEIKLNTFASFSEESSGDRGRKYTALSPIEDYSAKMALIASDHMVLPVLADKPTYHTLTGVKLHHEPISIHKENGNNVVFLGDRILRQFLDYVMDEWDTIREYYSDSYQQILRDQPEKRVKYYHTENKGGRFRYFTGAWLNVDGVEEYTDFNKLLDEAQTKGNIQDVLDMLETEFFSKEPYFKLGVINELLKRSVLNEIETARKLGIITTTERETSRIPIIKNRLLDQVLLSDKVNTYKQSSDPEFANNAETYAILDMLSDYTTNTIVSIIEFEKVFSKDPAFYGNPDNKTKRLSGLTSTGDNLRTSWEPGDKLVGRTSYSVAEIEDNMITSQQQADLYELFKRAYLAEYYEAELDIEPNSQFYKIAEQKARADVEAYGYDNINETDAMVYLSPQMYLDILEMLGESGPEVEEAFRIIESDDSWLSDPKKYAKAIKTLIKPLKMTSFNDIFDTDLRLDIPVYDKMALFPMFKVLAKGDNIELYNRMTAQGKYANQARIDMVKMNSAVKVGNRNVGKFYTDSSNTKISDLRKWTLYSQNFENLRHQLVTDPHTSERQLFGTQVAKGALSNLDMHREYGNEAAGLPKLPGYRIRNEVFGAMNALSNQGAVNFMNKIGEVVDNVFVNDISKLSAILQRDAKITGLSYDVIEGLGEVDGRLRAPLSALSDSKWLESRFISLVNKHTVDINLPGGAFIQMSVFATKSITTTGDSLLFRNEDGSMDAKVSVNLFKHMIPAKYSKTHADMVNWLTENNIIGKNSQPVAIGYRIPTQGLSSIVALKIVEVLPEIVADTIILPSEFTKLTGSDFDIDKLFVARYNYEAIPTTPLSLEESSKIEADFKIFVSIFNYSPNARKEIIRTQIEDYDEERAKKEYANKIDKYYDKGTWYNKKETGIRRVPFIEQPHAEAVWEAKSDNLRRQGFDEDYITKEYLNWIADGKNKTKWELNSREANENRLLDMYLSVLTDDSKVNETRMALDTPTTYLKTVVLKNIEGDVNGRVATPYETVSPSYQLDKKYEYTGGKRGIGPFALNNVHHVLTQLENLTFKPHKVLMQFGLNRLDRINSLDENGTRILDWLSALINAHVDVAKDPYIVRMNVVRWTYNMTNLLLRTGLGENTFYFVSQQILKDMAQKVASTTGRFGVDKTKSMSQLEMDAVEAIRDDYYNKAKELATDEQLQDLDLIFVSNPDNTLVIPNKHVLWDKQFLLNQLRKSREQDFDFDYYYNQLLIHRTFEQLEPYARGLSELVHTTQIDTKKTGNNFMLQKSFLYRVKRNIIDNRVFYQKDLKRFYKNTFLDTKLRNSIIFAQSIFKDKLIRANDQFISYHNAVLSLMGQIDTQNERTINQVSNALEAKIKTGFFTQYIADNKVSVFDMLFGDNSMSYRLIDLKSQILAGTYPEMIDDRGHIKNEFLNYIDGRPGNYTYDGYAAPDYITTNALNFNDKYLKNRLKRYWQELLNSEHETVRKFAEDLVVFAFITSGDNPTMHNIFDLVPLDYREKIGYTQYISDTMDQMNEGLLDMNLDDVFKNNWFNGSMVPDITFSRTFLSFDGYRTDTLDHVLSMYALPNSNLRYPTVIFDKRAMPIGSNSNSETLFRPYVKYNLDGTKNPQTTILYKHVGNYEDGDRIIPVYTAVHKKGINIGGLVVTEYDGYSNSALGFNNLPNNKEAKLTANAEDINAIIDNAYFTTNYEKEQMRQKLSKVRHITDFNLVDISNAVTYDYTMANDISTRQQADSEIEVTQDATLAEIWTSKEGWSIEYFNTKVLPKIQSGEAYQIEYEYIPDYNGKHQFEGNMNFSYGKNKLPSVTSNTTIDAVINGERTATTRYTSQGNIKCWQNAKVGDVIKWKSDDKVAYTRVTNPLTKLEFAIEPETTSTETTIYFHSKTQGLETLSNFYGSTITYDGLEYATAEHAFQAQKATKDDIKWAFSTDVGLTPAQAKAAGRRVAMRPDWDSIKDQVMYDILKAKFDQNDGARAQLLSTGNSELIHNTGDRAVFRNNDSYWGNGFDGNGLNKMGQILMQIRNEYITDNNSHDIQIVNFINNIVLSGDMAYSLANFEENAKRAGYTVTDADRYLYGKKLSDAHSPEIANINWKKGLENGSIIKDSEEPGGYLLTSLHPNAGGTGGHIAAYREYYKSRYDYGLRIMNRYNKFANLQNNENVSENDFSDEAMNNCKN